MNIDKLVANAESFAAENRGRAYEASKFPALKTAIVSCMDTRLTLLLPAALGLRNGDVKLITNAGGVIADPYGDTVRSLLVAIYELGVEEIMVIGHTNCGAAGLDPAEMRHLMHERGISDEAIAKASECVELDEWLTGHGDTPEAVRRTVALLENHPLIPNEVKVRGYVMDTMTGGVTPV